jgi:hypothetical protein
VETRNQLAPHIAYFASDALFKTYNDLFLVACAAYEKMGAVKPEDSGIYAIGDEYAMFLSHQDTEFGQIFTIPLPQLTIDGLLGPTLSISKPGFWHQLSGLKNSRYLIICLGTHDIRTTFPFLLSRNSAFSTEDALNAVATEFIPVLGQIRNLLPGTRMAVHAVFLQCDEDRPFVDMLNEALRVISEGAYDFLDVSGSIPAMTGVLPEVDAKMHRDNYSKAIQDWFMREKSRLEGPIVPLPPQPIALDAPS